MHYARNNDYTFWTIVNVINKFQHDSTLKYGTNAFCLVKTSQVTFSATGF